MTDETQSNVVILGRVRPGRGVAAPRQDLAGALEAGAVRKAAELRREATVDEMLAEWTAGDDPEISAAYAVLAAAKIALADVLEG